MTIHGVVVLCFGCGKKGVLSMARRDSLLSIVIQTQGHRQQDEPEVNGREPEAYGPLLPVRSVCGSGNMQTGTAV